MTARAADINGWFEIKDNPLSKSGVFPYSGAAIDRDGSMGLDPDKKYNVYRPESELSDQDCIDSFKLLPWINEHQMLGENMTPAEEKGIEGVIGEDVYFDSESKTLKGNIKIFSERLKSSIDNGKEELSCGFRCKWVLEGGIFNGERYDVTQRVIRGNHLALVDQGRMGPDVAVLDQAEYLSFTIDSKEFRMEPENKEGTEGGAQDMSLSEVTATLKDIMPQIKALMEAMSSMNAPAEAGDEEEENAEDTGGNGPAKDAEEKPDEEAKDEKDGEGMDSLVAKNKELEKTVSGLKTAMDSMEKDGMKNLLSQISKRDSLAKNLSDHIGVFDHAEMTLQEVAVYGADKLEIACDSKNAVIAVGGYLHGRKPSTQGHGLDSAKASSNAISSYLNGERS